MMWRVAVKDVVAHPAAYILGRGWGNFPSMEETWTREVGGRLYDTRWPGAGLTVWDARTKAFFHPHNMFLDAFLSAGPLGAALWLYLVLTPLLFARHRARLPAVALSLGLVVYGSLWFLVNSSAGLLALALAVTTSPAAGEVVRQRVAYGRAAAMLALLAAGGLFTTSAMSAMSSLPEETWLRHTITTQGPPPVAAIDDCSPVGGFLHPRRQITTKLYGVLAASVAGAPDRAAEMQRLAPEVARITCATRAVLRKDPDAWSLVVQASARTGLFYIFAPEPRIVGGLMKPELLSWDDDLDRLLAIAPERTDLVAYRFEWAMATHRYQDARIIASEAQRIMDPGDPVALLIAGHVDWLNGGKEASALLSKAFRRGIDDLIEVNTNMVVSPAQVGR
jgi:hypothetical protein